MKMNRIMPVLIVVLIAAATYTIGLNTGSKNQAKFVNGLSQIIEQKTGKTVKELSLMDCYPEPTAPAGIYSDMAKVINTRGVRDNITLKF